MELELTFTLTVTGTEHQEWQGFLETPQGVQPFCSLLELIGAMRQSIAKETEEKE